MQLRSGMAIIQTHVCMVTTVQTHVHSVVTDDYAHRWGPGGGGMDGGSRCRMSIIRNGNVALSNLRIDTGAWDVIGVIEYISCSP